MTKGKDIWAVIPVKETAGAKQRLSASVPEDLREELVLTMLEDVVAAVAAVRELAGFALITLDPKATAIARRYGARILTDGARNGHTGAVRAAARLLAAEGVGGMMQLPGDIPAVTGAELNASGYHASRGSCVHDRAIARRIWLQHRRSLASECGTLDVR